MHVFWISTNLYYAEAEHKQENTAHAATKINSKITTHKLFIFNDLEGHS